MYYFFAFYNNRKSFQMSTIRSNRKCSKVVETSSDILGNARKSLENRRNLREWLGCFRKSRSSRGKKLMRLTQKKLARI